MRVNTLILKKICLIEKNLKSFFDLEKSSRDLDKKVGAMILKKHHQKKIKKHLEFKKFYQARWKCNFNLKTLSTQSKRRLILIMKKSHSQKPP